MADVTCIRKRSGWLPLAVVPELFARQVVGLAMAAHIQTGLVCRALQLAIVQRQPAPGRFFLNLQMERFWQRDCANRAEVTSGIADHIVSFCNSVCLHSKLGNLSPNSFEQQSAIN